MLTCFGEHQLGVSGFGRQFNAPYTASAESLDGTNLDRVRLVAGRLLVAKEDGLSCLSLVDADETGGSHGFVAFFDYFG